MKKARNTAESLGNDVELDDIELSDGEYRERTLILKAAPPSRRLQLIAHGAKEIRCSRCDQIKPLAGAEEDDAGWVCEDCGFDMLQEQKNRQAKERVATKRGLSPTSLSAKGSSRPLHQG